MAANATASDRAEIIEELPRRPAGLQGVRRRALPISRLEAAFRRKIAKSAKELGRRLNSKLRTSGALAEIARDAAKKLDGQSKARRRGQPAGQGGGPLGEDRANEIRRLFSESGMAFFAELIQGDVVRWTEEMEDLLLDQYVDLYDAGGAGAMRKLGIRPNFHLRNPGIIEALTERANMLSGGFGDDMFDRLRTVVAEEFYVKGAGPFEVADSLQDEFNFFSRARAELVARTETLTITSEAQHTLYEASGVYLKRWLTTLDGKERYAHFKAHGQLRPIDEPFDLTDEDGIDYALMFPGDPEGDISQIANCRCIAPGTRVDAHVVAALRTEYVGPMVEITTLAGRRLSVTPNHPVLTDKGFLLAGTLRKGDQLLCHKERPEDLSLTGLITLLADENQTPTAIENVFGALSARTAMVSKDVSPLDLHGDGRFAQSQIEMVRADAPLWVGGNPKSIKRALQEPFVAACLATTSNPFSRQDLVDGAPVNSVPLSKAECRRSGAVLVGNPAPVEVLEVGPGCEFRFPHVTKCDAVFFEDSRNHLRGDSIFAGDNAIASAGSIATDEVCDIRQHHFSGHVYDLQTVEGAYAANGILSHNCDHVPIVSEGQLLSDDAVWRGDNDPDEFSRERLRGEKHLGPGPHPSGSPQVVHAFGGEAGPRLEKMGERLKKYPYDIDDVGGLFRSDMAKQYIGGFERIDKKFAAGWVRESTDDVGLAGKILAGSATPEEEARFATAVGAKPEKAAEYVALRYLATQKALAAAKIPKEQRLYRGVSGAQAKDIADQIASGAKTIKVSVRSISSFSSNDSVARLFATHRGSDVNPRSDNAVMLSFKAPRERMLAHHRVEERMGNLFEDEVVVWDEDGTIEFNASDVQVLAHQKALWMKAKLRRVILLDEGDNDNWLQQYVRAATGMERMSDEELADVEATPDDSDLEPEDFPKQPRSES